jgi:hypothetical protein
MEERMSIFWARYNNQPYPWTNDKILQNNKFTNVYRATDRVSQYLIKNVIYPTGYEKLTEEDILLRILIFKVFNKIETWEYIKSFFGDLTLKSYNAEKISHVLSIRIKDHPIFNSAYLMTGVHRDYTNLKSKHERWLKMIDLEFIKNKLFIKIIKARSLQEVFTLLSGCPFIGDFLAYQYAIDFNYSPFMNFDENSFVKAGIGALRGIKKCFIDMGSYTNDDLIRYTQENLYFFRNKYGYANFINLFGREPSLIDLQNCFCETDKYLRAKMPELVVDNTRIKQKYLNSNDNVNFFFPPKWGLNDKIETKCLQPSLMELTLF